MTITKSLLLAAVPWLLVFYGPRIRTRSKYAKVNGPFDAVLKDANLVFPNSRAW
jgi:hypothetical protein